MDHASLYRRVMGSDFAVLAPELQRFHSVQGRIRLSGSCTILGAETAPARWIGRLLGLPPACFEAPMSFVLDADAEREIWERGFPGRRMVSCLRARGTRLVERLGPVTLWMDLEPADRLLIMRLKKVSVFGLPWPSFLLPRLSAVERTEAGRLHFDIEIGLPVLGRMVAYRGHLDLATAEAAA